MVLKLSTGEGERLFKIAQAQSLFVVKIAHFGTFICGFSCRTASSREEWTSRCLRTTATRPQSNGGAFRERSMHETVRRLLRGVMARGPSVSAWVIGGRGPRTEACKCECTGRNAPRSAAEVTLELLFLAFHAERHPTMRNGLRGLHCSLCSPTAETCS
jgi:hypothetical protein